MLPKKIVASNFNTKTSIFFEYKYMQTVIKVTSGQI